MTTETDGPGWIGHFKCSYCPKTWSYRSAWGYLRLLPAVIWHETLCGVGRDPAFDEDVSHDNPCAQPLRRGGKVAPPEPWPGPPERVTGVDLASGSDRTVIHRPPFPPNRVIKEGRRESTPPSGGIPLRRAPDRVQSKGCGICAHWRRDAVSGTPIGDCGIRSWWRTAAEDTCPDWTQVGQHREAGEAAAQPAAGPGQCRDCRSWAEPAGQDVEPWRREGTCCNLGSQRQTTKALDSCLEWQAARHVETP